MHADRPVTSPWTTAMVYGSLAHYAELAASRESIADVEAERDISAAIIHLPTEFQAKFAAWHWLLQQPAHELEVRLGWETGSADKMIQRIGRNIRQFLMRGVGRSRRK